MTTLLVSLIIVHLWSGHSHTGLAGAYPNMPAPHAAISHAGQMTLDESPDVSRDGVICLVSSALITNLGLVSGPKVLALLALYSPVAPVERPYLPRSGVGTVRSQRSSRPPGPLRQAVLQIFRH